MAWRGSGVRIPLAPRFTRIAIAMRVFVLQQGLILPGQQAQPADCGCGSQTIAVQFREAYGHIQHTCPERGVSNIALHLLLPTLRWVSVSAEAWTGACRQPRTPHRIPANRDGSSWLSDQRMLNIALRHGAKPWKADFVPAVRDYAYLGFFGGRLDSFGVRPQNIHRRTVAQAHDSRTARA